MNFFPDASALSRTDRFGIHERGEHGKVHGLRLVCPAIALTQALKLIEIPSVCRLLGEPRTLGTNSLHLAVAHPIAPLSTVPLLAVLVLADADYTSQKTCIYASH